jgi:hypothetical protein
MEEAGWKWQERKGGSHYDRRYSLPQCDAKLCVCWLAGLCAGLGGRTNLLFGHPQPGLKPVIPLSLLFKTGKLSIR